MEVGKKNIKNTKIVKDTKKPKVSKTNHEGTPKLKRPASAYILFTKDERVNILKENPSLKVGEIAKILVEKWKN